MHVLSDTDIYGRCGSYNVVHERMYVVSKHVVSLYAVSKHVVSIPLCGAQLLIEADIPPTVVRMDPGHARVYASISHLCEAPPMLLRRLSGAQVVLPRRRSGAAMSPKVTS